MEEDKAAEMSVASQPRTLLKENKPYRCQACGEMFDYAWLLVRHLWIHTAVQPFSCDQCSSSFKDLANLDQHKREKHHVEGGKHEKEKKITRPHKGRFQCDQCGRGFKTKKDLRRHQCLKLQEVKDEVEEITVTLNEEPQISNSTINSSLHWKCTDSDNECKHCGMRFPNFTRLKIHQRNHEGKQVHKCQYCGIEFLTKGNLRNHKETHKSIKCGRCGKRFFQKDELKLHKCPLDKEKYTCYFMCAHCGIKCSSRKELTKHQLQFSHIGKKMSLKKPERLGDMEKDYDSYNHSPKALLSVKHEETSAAISALSTCDVPATKDKVVPTVASQTSNLQTSTEEEQIKKHKCLYCEKRFRTVTHLKEHTYCHIGRPYKCDLCWRTFIRPGRLRKHQDTCKERSLIRTQCSCGVEFPNEAMLHAHVEEFHTIDHYGNNLHVNSLTHNSLTVHGKYNEDEVQNKPDRDYYRSSDRTYNCQLCDEIFTFYNKYIVHCFTEHGKIAEPPYGPNGDHNYNSYKHNCDHCGESFLDPGSLSIHKCNNQSTEKTLKCLECGTVVKVGDTTLSNVFSVTDFSNVKCFINNHTLL